MDWWMYMAWVRLHEVWINKTFDSLLSGMRPQLRESTRRWRNANDSAPRSELSKNDAFCLSSYKQTMHTVHVYNRFVHANTGGTDY